MRHFTIVLLAVSAVAQVSALPVHRNGVACGAVPPGSKCILRHDLDARYHADGVYGKLSKRRPGRKDQPTSGMGRPKPKPQPKPKPTGGSTCCTVMRRDGPERGLGQ
ncbi:uncharacterized protein B0H18DRAFT_1019717 [Fomitopsis serialis]|uniref:uncharacterized protein n=1 Tax=Fomitopsis serialis TaxID=139415 RepID=UPI00200743E5|nr:uncharacterized protein B0H18DRAFT_1019717 [Neoantrodia serialis]KAH9921897.1 hypothetical protein B0H18DRAFT_1019717 [Neoantrodia serialis]